MAGTITALVIQKRNKKRVNVYLDGDFAFGLALTEAAALHKGQHLSDAEIEALHTRDQAEHAHERALNFLSHRPRSAEEVRSNLRKHGTPDGAIEATIARLTRVGLVDDEAFARYWIENRQRFKPRGLRALRYELRQKGVADQIINAALEDIDAETMAYNAAMRYQRRLEHADYDTFRRKMSNHLARRGFAYAVIQDVVQRLLDEQQNVSHV
jgi:regulatory protein